MEPTKLETTILWLKADWETRSKLTRAAVAEELGVSIRTVSNAKKVILDASDF